MPDTSSNPVIHEMKLWFLEQKVRQLELDVHKQDTKLMLINENMGQHNKQKSKMNTNNAPVGDRLSRTSTTTNDTDITDIDHNASLNDSLCTKLDDLILNMRDDEALDLNEEDASNKTIAPHETNTKKVHNLLHRPNFLDSPIPKKVRLKDQPKQGTKHPNMRSKNFRKTQHKGHPHYNNMIYQGRQTQPLYSQLPAQQTSYQRHPNYNTAIPTANYSVPQPPQNYTPQAPQTIFTPNFAHERMQWHNHAQTQQTGHYQF